MKSETADSLTQDLGLLILAFLRDWRWIERRVEAVTFPDEASVRRRVSVDFAVPDGWVSPLPRSEGAPPTFYVPFALLRKQGLIRFDLRDESGRALPLLTRDHNGRLAQATLVELAKGINDDRGRPMKTALPEPLLKELWVITNGPADSALVVWNHLEEPKTKHESEESQEWRDFLVTEDKFMALAQDFAVGFPLIAPVTGEPGVRRIVKFSYQGSAPPRRPSSRPRQLGRGIGWRPRTERIVAPSIGQGGCFHLEVQAPEGLQITRGTLISSEQPKPTLWQDALPDVIKPGSDRVHMHLSAPGTAEGMALVNLRARPSTISRAAFATAFLTMVALAVAGLQHEVLDENLSSAVTLFLLVPTALSVYVARPREPIITTGLLLGQRLLALSCGGLAVAGATLLVVGRSCHRFLFSNSCQQWSAVPWLLWMFSALAGAIALVLLVTVYFTSNPPEKADIE